MSDTTSNPAGKGHCGAIWVIVVLLAIYFLLPCAYTLPVWSIARATGNLEPVGKGIEVFFAPVIFLYDHVPPYKALIDAEAKVIQIEL